MSGALYAILASSIYIPKNNYISIYIIDTIINHNYYVPSILKLKETQTKESNIGREIFRVLMTHPL